MKRSAERKKWVAQPWQRSCERSEWGQHEWDQYEQIYERVALAVNHLRQLFASLDTKRKERAWQSARLAVS